jgi:hypothetical protein
LAAADAHALQQNEHAYILNGRYAARRAKRPEKMRVRRQTVEHPNHQGVDGRHVSR